MRLPHLRIPASILALMRESVCIEPVRIVASSIILPLVSNLGGGYAYLQLTWRQERNARFHQRERFESADALNQFLARWAAADAS